MLLSGYCPWTPYSFSRFHCIVHKKIEADSEHRHDIPLELVDWRVDLLKDMPVLLLVLEGVAEYLAEMLVLENVEKHCMRYDRTDAHGSNVTLHWKHLLDFGASCPGTLKMAL